MNHKSAAQALGFGNVSDGHMVLIACVGRADPNPKPISRCHTPSRLDAAQALGLGLG